MGHNKNSKEDSRTLWLFAGLSIQSLSLINKKQSFNQYYKNKLVPGCICYLVFGTGYNVKKNNDNEYRQGRRKGIINSTLRY
jgi:hypothetical protein